MLNYINNLPLYKVSMALGTNAITAIIYILCVLLELK